MLSRNVSNETDTSYILNISTSIKSISFQEAVKSRQILYIFHYKGGESVNSELKGSQGFYVLLKTIKMFSFLDVQTISKASQ